MQIICQADDSHEMTNIIFSKKILKQKKKKKKKLECRLLQFWLAL